MRIGRIQPRQNDNTTTGNITRDRTAGNHMLPTSVGEARSSPPWSMPKNVLRQAGLRRGSVDVGFRFARYLPTCEPYAITFVRASTNSFSDVVLTFDLDTACAKAVPRCGQVGEQVGVGRQRQQ